MSIQAFLFMILSLAGPDDNGRNDSNNEDFDRSRQKAVTDRDLKQPGPEKKTSKTASTSTAFYVRTDTDKTLVLTPLVHFRSNLGTKSTNIDVVYTADVWTSASIDIRTAATAVKVTEQRDEIDLGIDHERGLWLIGAGYRFSHEVDYLSNSLALSFKYEAFQRNTVFEGRPFFSYDLVGRSGDRFFSRPLQTSGLWLGVSQVLTKKTVAQLSYEWRLMRGYLASPYRYVGIGGIAICTEDSWQCMAEVHPNTKIRNALVLRIRHALHRKLSIGGSYRFYFDNWKIQSHTLAMDLNLLATRYLVWNGEYRLYSQGAASFYRKSYPNVELFSYFTRDRELSPLNSHRIGTRLEWQKRLSSRPIDISLGTMIAGTFYKYKDFPGLEKVSAFEFSFNTGVQY